jgi:ribosomal protein L7/L12
VTGSPCTLSAAVSDDLETRTRALEERVAALERRLAELQGSTRDPAADLPEDVVTLLREGKRVDAVKRYMKLEGVTLKDATYAIDAVDTLGRTPIE